jgi:hypothetical protein
LDEQKGMAAQRIEGVANALRQAGQELAGRDEGTLAHYTDSLAGQLDRFSNTLREREIGSLIDDAKQLAHRQPELFVAGALAAGFVLGRFFKSSRQSAMRNQYGRDYEYDYNYGYNEYDPRDSSRRYGEPYGRRYGEELSRSRGPEYSRDYDGGYRSGYQSEYGTRYGQGPESRGESREEWREEWRRDPNDNWSHGSSGQATGSGGPSTTQFRQGTPGTTGQVTTHGLGTGQSIDRQEEIHEGQEFGRGEEQVSNYKGTETQTASQMSKGPNAREDQPNEGELR